MRTTVSSHRYGAFQANSAKGEFFISMVTGHGSRASNVCKLMDTVATSAGIFVAARFPPKLCFYRPREAVLDKQVGTVKVAERLVHGECKHVEFLCTGAPSRLLL